MGRALRVLAAIEGEPARMVSPPEALAYPVQKEPQMVSLVPGARNHKCETADDRHPFVRFRIR